MMLSEVQKKQTELNEDLSLNTKDAWLWLCNKAKVVCNCKNMDCRTLDLRQKATIKQETKTDKSFKIDRELTQEEKQLIKNIKLFLTQPKATKEKALKFLSEAGHDDKLAAYWLSQALEQENPINPFK